MWDGRFFSFLVHEDKKKAPEVYARDGANPLLDANIDHRRVPNLMLFFQREGKEVPISNVETDYLPGDIVTWRLPSGLLHVGLVTDQFAPGTKRPLLVHNIGEGAQCEDVLFLFHACRALPVVWLKTTHPSWQRGGFP